MTIAREARVAVEIEGINRFAPHPGRHRSAEGYAEDALKYSEAAVMGICVIRCAASQMNDGTMVDLARRALAARGFRR